MFFGINIHRILLPLLGITKTDIVDITFGERLEKPAKTLLYTNALYLVADVAVVSIFGFAFWTIAARLYSPSQFGVASATISVIIFLARISQIGLDYSIVRFLSNAGKKSTALINSCFTFTGLTSLITALIFFWRS
ncbi:oligosaccharide flippase family protein [Chloroflexota bacterium]